MNHKKNPNDKVYFRRTLLSSAVVIGLQAMAMPTAAQACATPDGSNNIQVAQGEICSSGITPEQPVNNIKNAGTVNSEVYGIHITGDSPVTGDIENAVGGVIDTVDNGIYIDGGTVNGSIINNGSITSENDHALDLEEATIGGSIIINGNLTSEITYDAIDVNDSKIQGDVLVTANAILIGDDGIDIDESLVGGSVISEATINSRREGFDLDNTTITNDLINRGQIDAGRNGLSFSGEAEYIYPEIELPVEEGPAEIMVVSELEMMEEPDLAITKMTIGGNFTNEGNIDAGKRGVKLELVDIGGSFSNSGTIKSATDTTILVSSSTIEGDFINSGDLYADQPAAYEPGDLYYKSNDDTPITEGDNIVLTVLGVDSYNQVWLKISNEGTERKEMQLEGPEGIIFSEERLDTGQEIFVNVGEYDGGARSYQLIDLRTETPEVLGSVTESNQSFSPAIPDSDQEQKGIALFGHRYDDEEMETGSVSIGSNFINEGAITSIEEAILLYDTTIGDGFYNSGVLTSLDSDGILFLGNVSIGSEFINTGNINAQNSGIFLDGDAQLEDGILAGEDKILIGGNLINEGDITVQDHGIALFGTEVDGHFINRGNITVEQEGSAIYLNFDRYGIEVVNSQIAGSIINQGDIDAYQSAVFIKDADISGGLSNSGIMTSEYDATIKVVNSSLGTILNTGTINGGAVSGDMVEAGRTISDGSTVAMDFRTALSRLDFQNSGTVNGDIYGTTQTDDIIELLSGALNSNIFDVESINVTGRTTISGDIFSVNDSSTLTIAETGTLVVGSGDQIKVEGRFIQDGTLAATLEQGVTDPAEPLIDVTSTATLNENSTVTLALADRNIAGFISDFAGNDIHLIGAAGGVTDNGMVTQADSLLFSYDTVIKDADTTLGVNGRVNDLGEIVASNGAGVNAANAISTLQGENSVGLVDLYTSNSELYNAIYDASLDDLTLLAEELASGNPATGIAASQNAQNEAVNTILNRIADLRSGASGISAGDSQSLSVRPDSVWIGGIYSDGEQDASGELGRYNLKSKGFTLGADKDINDYLTLGLGVTVVNSTAQQSSQGGIGNNSETDSYLGSFYASWRDGGYFIDGNFNMGVSRTDLSGRVGNNSWKSDFNSKQMFASVKVGKSFLFNNNDTLVEPSIGVNYSRLKSDGYDYNAGVNTHVKSATLSALEAGIGVRAMTSIEIGSGLLLPEASVMAWHDFKADSVETDISFENSGDSFTYFGPKGIKNRYQISVGAEYQMGNNVTLSASYDHNWQSGFKADTVQAKLRYDF